MRTPAQRGELEQRLSRHEQQILLGLGLQTPSARGTGFGIWNSRSNFVTPDSAGPPSPRSPSRSPSRAHGTITSCAFPNARGATPTGPITHCESSLCSMIAGRDWSLVPRTFWMFSTSPTDQRQPSKPSPAATPCSAPTGALGPCLTSSTSVAS